MLTRGMSVPRLPRGLGRAITWIGVRILVASAVLWLADSEAGESSRPGRRLKREGGRS